MSYGNALRKAIKENEILPFIGVYDIFSAVIASQFSNALFLSGYGFAASHYGMPDIGFISWTDMLDFVRRVRAVLPHHHILVDIDDGYVDIETARHVAKLLFQAGASGFIMEDQNRPKKCGHSSDKNILDLDSYLKKLMAVIDAKNDLYIVARTDAENQDDIHKRISAFQQYNIDCILVDGIPDVTKVVQLIRSNKNLHVAYNQIYGGKSVSMPLSTLKEKGVNVAIYSTPCLFAAQKAISNFLQDFKKSDFDLNAINGMVTLKDCNDLLNLSLHNAIHYLEKPDEK